MKLCLIGLAIALSVPTVSLAATVTVTDVEMGSDSDRTAHLVQQSININPKQTVILLMDVWDLPGSDTTGIAARVRTLAMDKIGPLIATLRSRGYRIAHAPHGRKVSRYTPEMRGDWHLDRLGIRTASQWKAWLQLNGITTVLYTGGASNQCLVTRPIAPYVMQTLYGRTFRHILVEDASLAIEYPATVQSEGTHKSMVWLFRQAVGSTTSVDQLIRGL